MDIQQAIQQINTEFSELYDRLDATAISAAYLEDGAWKGFFDELGGAASIETVEIAGEGDVAYQWATYTLAGGAQSDAGKFVEVYKRHADGSWKIRLTIFNSDNP
jgi:ketosteroid isomerase-like protein